MFGQRLLSVNSRSIIGLAGRRNFAAEVSAAMVKELRTLSGAPLLDCRHALAHETVQGDLQKAMDWLRAKGLKKFAQSQRVTNEGLIAIFYSKQQPNKVTLVEVNCETDFVSMNKDFQNFVALTASTVHSNPLKGPSVDSETVLKLISTENKTVHDSLGDIISIIRENITLKRVSIMDASSEGNDIDFYSVYVHGKVAGGSHANSNVQMGKAVGVVHLSATPSADINKTELVDQLQEHLGRKLAMHVVAGKPQFLSPNQVPADIVEKETAIFKEQMKDEKKKANVIEGIIKGKLKKRLSEICLLEQNHVAEEGSPVVSKHLENVAGKLGLAKVQIKGFELWNLTK